MDEEGAVAHPEALEEWQALAGVPSPDAEAWARRALGLAEPEQRAS